MLKKLQDKLDFVPIFNDEVAVEVQSALFQVENDEEFPGSITHLLSVIGLTLSNLHQTEELDAAHQFVYDFTLELIRNFQVLSSVDTWTTQRHAEAVKLQFTLSSVRTWFNVSGPNFSREVELNTR
jgi:hypothetical protein